MHLFFRQQNYKLFNNKKLVNAYLIITTVFEVYLNTESSKLIQIV